MALASTDLAKTVARVGVARIGATRMGFVPLSTQGPAPASNGGLYSWRAAAPNAGVDVTDEIVVAPEVPE